MQHRNTCTDHIQFTTIHIFFTPNSQPILLVHPQSENNITVYDLKQTDRITTYKRISLSKQLSFWHNKNTFKNAYALIDL